MSCREYLIPHITQNADREFLLAEKVTKKYSVSTIWRAIRIRRSCVSWWRLVWSPPSTPRYSFICWQLMFDRLPLKDKLVKWGITIDSVCYLCDVGLETREHLFLTCPYSAHLRSKLFPGNTSPGA